MEYEPPRELDQCRHRSTASTDRTRDIIERHAHAVLEALKARDGSRLATLVHPTDGLRFSPYANVRPDSDVVIKREVVASIFTSGETYVWGTSDGSGEAIKGTFSDYYRRFVYHADFVNAPRVAYDSAPLRHGNTPSNIPDVYPGAHRVEYHFPGFEARYGGMDWSSLWLVFQRAGEEWYLVGIGQVQKSV